MGHAILLECQSLAKFACKTKVYFYTPILILIHHNSLGYLIYIVLRMHLSISLVINNKSALIHLEKGPESPTFRTHSE